MTTTTVAVLDRMIGYVNDHPGTSVGELEHLAAGMGVPVDGDTAVEICPNGVLWAGTSPEFGELLLEFINNPAINGRTMSPMEAVLVSSFDGSKMPALPVAQRAPRDLAKGYAKPRWLPFIFQPRAT